MKEFIESILLALQNDLITKEQAKMLAIQGFKSWFAVIEEEN